MEPLSSVGVSMAEDISYIRKWIKRGLSKDKKTLDFSNRGIDNQTAMDLAENVALPDIEILYIHTNKIKDWRSRNFSNRLKNSGCMKICSGMKGQRLWPNRSN